MINNIWLNRLAVLVLMFAVYAAGQSDGMDRTSQINRLNPPCKTHINP